MSEPTEVRADPDAAEEFAEEVGVDPTQEEIDHYRQLEGEPPAAEPITPDAELPDTGLTGEPADAALADPAVS
jgi:hypothetical protein